MCKERTSLLRERKAYGKMCIVIPRFFGGFVLRGFANSQCRPQECKYNNLTCQRTRTSKLFDTSNGSSSHTTGLEGKKKCNSLSECCFCKQFFFFWGGGQLFEDFRLSRRFWEPNPREKRQMTVRMVVRRRQNGTAYTDGRGMATVHLQCMQQC